MVSHSHLSAGNSVSSPSRDLFAEFGISGPSSPSFSSPSVPYCEDMVESEALPIAIAISSEDSTSLDKELEVDVGPALSSEAQNIFRAAHFFSKNDRDEAIHERNRNLQLSNFISAHGFSVQDVNAFISEGQIADSVAACQVTDKSPVRRGVPTEAGEPSGVKPIPMSKPSFPGGQLAQISCVGEDEPLKCGTHTYTPTSAGTGSGPDCKISTVMSSPAEEGECPRVEAKSWSTIVSNQPEKPAVSLSYYPPSSMEGSILIKPPVEVLKRGNQIWSASLVGYFLHSKLPFKVVEPIARRLWGNMGLTKVLLHSKGYYIFKFQSPADRDKVLASGPWHFASKVIVLQPWKEGIEFSKSDCSKFPIWVKLSHVPLSYWSAEGISYIASGIGKPLIADDLTSKFDLLNYARVCIEVDASFSFPSTINVTVLNEDTTEAIIVPVVVEYQSRPPSCPVCHVFGHSPLKCPKSNYQWVPKPQPSSDPIGAATNPADLAGASPSTLNPDNVPTIMDSAHAQHDWVTVSRGTKNGADKPALIPAMATSNAFSPIADPGLHPVSDCDSPAMDDPLVSKLKVVDEKEGKDLKQKLRKDSEPNQNAKRRNKGKSHGGNTSH